MMIGSGEKRTNVDKTTNCANASAAPFDHKEDAEAGSE